MASIHVTNVVLMKNPANYTEDFSFHVRFDAVEELRSYYVFVAATVSADTARLHLVAGSSLQSGRSGRWPLPPPVRHRLRRLRTGLCLRQWQMGGVRLV